MKKLGFGLMRLPQSKNEEWGNVDLEKTQQMIDAYIEQGFSYFDTAWVYHGGFSEKIFGELVAKRYPREKFQVTSKMPVWELKSENDLDRIFAILNILTITFYMHSVEKILTLQKNLMDLIFFKRKKLKVKLNILVLVFMTQQKNLMNF